MKILTIDEARKLFPDVNFSVKENFIKMTQMSSLSSVNRDYLNTKDKALAFSNKLGKAFFYDGGEAAEIIHSFDLFVSLVRNREDWRPREDKGYIEYFFQRYKIYRFYNLKYIRRIIHKISNSLNISFKHARKLFFELYPDIAERLDGCIIDFERYITYVRLPVSYNGIYSCCLRDAHYRNAIGLINFDGEKILINRNISGMVKIKQTKLWETYGNNKLDYLVFLILTYKSPEEKMQVNDKGYKKIKKILESNKTNEEKYFLIKCFLAS
jgi:hypothetical protein